jgi:hypothetical protein
METAVVSAVLSGVFSLLAVWLKHWLEHRRPNAQPGGVGRALAVVAVGFCIGVASRVARSGIPGPMHYETLLSIALLGGICLVLAWTDGRAGRGVLPYQLEAFALWAAFDAGWSLIHGGLWSDLIITSAGFWIACAIAGGIVAAVAGRTRRTA